MSEVARNILSIEESAHRLGVSHWTIRRLVGAGQLKTVNIGTRVMVLRTAIERCEKYGVGKPRERKVKTGVRNG